MPDREKIVIGLHDIGGFIAGRIGAEQARNFLRTIDEVIALLKEQPQIVRCKDCKHRVDRGRKFPECDKHFLRAMDDWFCADGEKETE